MTKDCGHRTTDKSAFYNILQAVNWDTNIPEEEMEQLLNGSKDMVCGLSREALFIRCLERVAWHNLVPMWHGTENCAKLYTQKVRKGLRNDKLRQKYDFIFGLLRGEPVQAPKWDSEYCQELKRTFLSDRWNIPDFVDAPLLDD